MLTIVESGVVPINGQDFQINAEFQQDTLQLAEILDLDEVDAAKLYSQGQTDAASLDRSAVTSAAILFHRHREYILDCFRIALQLAGDASQEDDARAPFLTFIDLVLDRKINASQAGSGSQYWRRALDDMRSIERRLHVISDRLQSTAMLGHTHAVDYVEIMQFQRQSLLRQHEALGAICYYLVKASYTKHDDLPTLLDVLKKLDRFDAIALHYFPMTACSVSLFASFESQCSLSEARNLHETITSSKDADGWPLRSFRAAVIAIWLAEYSGRYVDGHIDSRLDGIDLDVESGSRSTRFMEALRDGALHFMLSVCQDVKSSVWFDAARHGLTVFLMQDGLSLQLEQVSAAGYFQDIVMEQFQTFTDAFITNMPDTLRKLKYEEDEQRRQMHGRLQLRSAEYELHLERFLVLISFAFEGFPLAAETFWADPDGNLFGFLQWASQRQSTPRVAAFCEMLRALSEGEECADSAHKFLVEEGQASAARFRRTGSLSWSHIIAELEFYSTSIRDKPAIQQGLGPTSGTVQPDLLVEPESAMMLECYLRLATHLLRQSGAAREWALTHPTFHLHEHLLLLCRSSIESRLRACAFSTLAALLTHKTREASDGMWTALDSWVSGAAQQLVTNARQANPAAVSASHEQVIFDTISVGFEEPLSFVNLLRVLIERSVDDDQLNDMLPFPESLGSAYRMPGIEPYIDFIMGRVFAVKSVDLPDPIHVRMIRVACLGFAVSCLGSFNEDLIVLANRSSISVDSAIRTSTLANYARLHPFARVMEWFFNEKVIVALFTTLIQDIQEVNNSDAESPLIQSLLASIDTVNLIMTLQATYLDIVRPIVKMQSTSRRPVVANSALASFEDAILNNIQAIASLGLYAGSGFETLSIASLRLLQKLSVSRKLAPPVLGIKNRRPEKSRLITALEYNNDAESVSRSLIQELQFEIRQVEVGPQSVGIEIKAEILKFLTTTLDACFDRPNLAHLLLGFECSAQSLSIAEDSLFANNNALFHAVMRLRLECPFLLSDSVLSWLCVLKDGAMQVLRSLWRSTLSAAPTLSELRANDFLFVEFLQQLPISTNVLWDGRPVNDPDFYLSESAAAHASFLASRAAFLEIVAIELQLAFRSGATSQRDRIKASLLGLTVLLDGQRLENMTIFDHLDFLELALSESVPLPESKWFNVRDFDLCRINTANLVPRFNIEQAEQVIALRTNELHSGGQLANAGDEQQVLADAHNLLLCLTANNRHANIAVAHMETLKAWTQLVIVMLTCCQFEAQEKQSFVLQVLQLILPRLDQSLSTDPSTSLLLIQLGKFLLQHANTSVELSSSAEMDVATERLFHLYQVSLDAIHSSQTSKISREPCYQICQKYLRSIQTGPSQALNRRRALQSFKASGDHLSEIICDDAYAGEGQCRATATLLLEALVAVSNEERSRHILESFTKVNFINVVVDTIRNFPSELQGASSTGEFASMTVDL